MLTCNVANCYEKAERVVICIDFNHDTHEDFFLCFDCSKSKDRLWLTRNDDSNAVIWPPFYRCLSLYVAEIEQETNT